MTELYDAFSEEQKARAARGVEILLDDYALIRYHVENDLERTLLDDAVQTAMKHLEDYDLKVGHMKALKDTEDKIKLAVAALGHSIRGLTWSAMFRKGYQRVSWNSKALDGYAAAHPEILPFRKSSAVAANVRLVITASLDESEEAENGE